MHITRIKIQNHSRLLDKEIKVRTHLVLVGANNSGKSSLLRILNLALGSQTSQLYANITSNDFREIEKPLVLEVELSKFTDDERALYPDDITVDSDTNLESMIVVLTATIDGSQVMSIDRRAKLRKRQLSPTQVSGFGWKLLDANLQTRDLRQGRKSLLDEILKTVELGSEIQGFEELTAALAEKLDSSPALGNLRSNLAAKLSDALPHRIDKQDLKFVPGTEADQDVLSDVRLHVSNGSVFQDVSQQSHGMLAIYSIAFYGLMNAGANVVAIDEPELHLHPTSQRSIARLMNKTRTQKILATHSSDIVSAFNPDSIVVVRPGGNLVQPKANLLSKDEKLFVHWWTRNRLEPLTSQCVVAVEGISDRIVVEKVAEITNRNLDRLGVSLVEVNGVDNMSSIQVLFGESGFNIPLYMLIDSDGKGDEEIFNRVNIENVKDNKVFLSRIDLEEEYVNAIGVNDLWAAIENSKIFSNADRAHCKTSGEGGMPTDADLAEFCRENKTKASLMVADMLTDDTARAIKSVDELLTALVDAIDDKANA